MGKKQITFKKFRLLLLVKNASIMLEIAIISKEM